MLFVDGNFSGFQLVDAIFIDVRAENFVTGGCEAGSGYESHIATPDYRQSHLRISFSVVDR